MNLDLSWLPKKSLRVLARVLSICIHQTSWWVDLWKAHSFIPVCDEKLNVELWAISEQIHSLRPAVLYMACDVLVIIVIYSQCAHINYTPLSEYQRLTGHATSRGTSSTSIIWAIYTSLSSATWILTTDKIITRSGASTFHLYPSDILVS